MKEKLLYLFSAMGTVEAGGLDFLEFGPKRGQNKTMGIDPNNQTLKKIERKH